MCSIEGVRLMKIKVDKLNDNFQYEYILNNKPYFISGVLQDEVIEVSINKEKRFIKVDKIIETSKHRIKPNCDIYDKCGGCKLLHVSYEHQLKLKTEMVKRLFLKNNIKHPVLDIIGMKNPIEYRNKNQVVFGYDDKKRNSHNYEQQISN